MAVETCYLYGSIIWKMVAIKNDTGLSMIKLNPVFCVTITILMLL